MVTTAGEIFDWFSFQNGLTLTWGKQNQAKFWGQENDLEADLIIKNPS